MLRNSAETYGLIAKIFHWLAAIFILTLLPVGWIMADMPVSPDKLKIYALHKSVGMTVLGLMILRLTWRATNPVPALPLMPRWQRLSAHLSHYGLYALAIAMPLFGWLMSAAAGFPVSYFGLFVLPNPIAPDPALREFFRAAHGVGAYLLAGLVALHIAAALYHHFIRRDNVLRRMLAAALIFAALPAQAAPLWQVDYKNSAVEFTAYFENAPVKGKFENFTAIIAFDPNDLKTSRIEAIIVINSLNTYYPERDQNLRGGDWFQTDIFPQAKFISEKIERVGENKYIAHGKLTMLNQSRPLDLPFEFSTFTANQAAAKAKAILPRKDFNLGKGDWAKSDVIKNEVEVAITLYARKDAK
ncbi:MAG: cytochrome b/b6 domain-containing protein [Dongiaceae bacterium]